MERTCAVVWVGEEYLYLLLSEVASPLALYLLSLVLARTQLPHAKTLFPLASLQAALPLRNQSWQRSVSTPLTPETKSVHTDVPQKKCLNRGYRYVPCSVPIVIVCVIVCDWNACNTHPLFLEISSPLRLGGVYHILYCPWLLTKLPPTVASNDFNKCTQPSSMCFCGSLSRISSILRSVLHCGMLMFALVCAFSREHQREEAQQKYEEWLQKKKAMEKKKADEARRKREEEEAARAAQLAAEEEEYVCMYICISVCLYLRLCVFACGLSCCT